MFKFNSLTTLNWYSVLESTQTEVLVLCLKIN